MFLIDSLFEECKNFVSKKDNHVSLAENKKENFNEANPVELLVSRIDPQLLPMNRNCFTLDSNKKKELFVDTNQNFCNSYKNRQSLSRNLFPSLVNDVS